jgi:Fur family transcriptional regulator, ferric uptake regulator
MNYVSEYVPQLHSRGFRVTSQRIAILHVLRNAKTHLSPTEVYKRARRDLPGLTETTVYRTLEFLAKNDLARLTHLSNGHLSYEIAGSDHDHLICRECGGEVEVEHALFKEVYAKLESISHYVLTDNHASIFGICPDCQKSNSGKGEPEHVR